MVDGSVLDNAVWHSLAGPHRPFAEVAGRAARYDADVSVFAARRDPAADDEDAWADLASLVGDGSCSLLGTVTPAAPRGWQRLGGGTAHQMVLGELTPAPVPDTRPLGTDDVGEMLALVEVARPGPFTVRTVELGGYVGVFDGPTLVAMAGERLAPPGFREISAVCTHPDHRGRGLAAGLTTLVARRILERGEWPFLHHAADNDPARRVYETLGFRFRRETSWAVLTPG